MSPSPNISLFISGIPQAILGFTKIFGIQVRDVPVGNHNLSVSDSIGIVNLSYYREFGVLTYITVCFSD